MKPRQSNQPLVLDTQIIEIDKQLKNIQNQKKEINRIISRELKDRKFRWQEVKDRGSFLNMKELANRAEDYQIKKIRETLGNSIQEVRNFNQSLASFRYSNNAISNRVKIANAQNETKFTHKNRGDNELASSKNISTKSEISFQDPLKEKIEQLSGSGNNKLETCYNKQVPSRASKSILNRSVKSSYKSLDKIHTVSDFAVNQGISRLNISDNPNHRVLKNSNDTDFKSFFEKPERRISDKPQSYSNIQRLDQSVSSQANTSAPSNFIKKYSVLQSKLPGVFKSEFLRKSCGFN